MKSAQDTLRDILVMLTAVGLIVFLAALGAHNGVDPAACLAIGGVGVTAILVGWVTKTGKKKREFSFKPRVSDLSRHPKAMAQRSSNKSRNIGAA